MPEQPITRVLVALLLAAALLIAPMSVFAADVEDDTLFDHLEERLAEQESTGDQTQAEEDSDQEDQLDGEDQDSQEDQEQDENQSPDNQDDNEQDEDEETLWNSIDDEDIDDLELRYDLKAEEEQEVTKTLSYTPTAVSELINSASLSPRDPQSQALDQLLDDILEDIIDDDMDTYEQVKACYDYLVATMRYGSNTSRLNTQVRDGVTCAQIYSAYGSVEGFAAVALTTQVGMCNAYNSAFIMMARKIGLDANLVKGGTRSAGGGFAYHEWTEVTINGNVYVFDPQLEQDLRKSGLAPYTVFGKTYAQIPGRYSKY